MNALGLLSVMCLLGGCDALSSLDGGTLADQEFVAVDVPEIGGSDGLTAKAGVVESEPATVTMPDNVLVDTQNEVSLTLQAESITVAIDGEVAGRRSPTFKGQGHHASITFRMAERDSDACDALETIGPFELTIIDGVVTLEQDSFPLNARFRSLVHGGRFEICSETEADFDGSISLDGASFEFGRLPNDEERVVLCHIPPEANEGNPHTITVGSSSVDAHLAHGDYLGDCDSLDDDGDDSGENDDGSEVDTDSDGVTDDADACPETIAGEIVDERGCSCAQHDGDNDGVDDCSDTCPHTASEDIVDESGCSEADIDDDDDDGVSDGTDACPDTLAGEAVDAVGCGCSQRDGDADGVNYCDDDCLNSESTAVVDETGCADADLDDDDGDGVINGSDTCASTPSGETVDATGCSCSQLDADSDGVSDCDDTCVSTSAGLTVNTSGCASNQIDDDNDGVMNDADTCANTATGATVDTNGCDCSQLDADSDGANDCNDKCAQTPAGETVDSNGCSTSQLTMTVTVPGPTDIYLSGQPDGTTATWSLTGFTSVAPQHSPKMIDVSAWAGMELRFTATGVVVTGGNNAATPDGRNWVLRPNGLSQVFGLTAMTDYKEGALVGVFLTAALPTSGLLPYMSSSGITTKTPLLQHIFVIGTSSQVVIPKNATRLFFGVAEQQGLIIDNSGSFDVTVEAIAHVTLPPDPLAATRFYTGNPNDPKDGIGWFDAGQWVFDYNFDGVADFTTTFGQAGDTPVVGDWNGDGLDEIGVMMPSASGNVWMLDMNGNGVFDAGDSTFTYGADAGAIAIAGDWDGDGTSELGFTTPDNLWHLDLNGDHVDGSGEALDTQYNRSISVVGDWTGDGISNLGNTPNGSVGWQFDLDNDRRWIWGTTYRDQNWSWGNPSIDTGVAGDWDGDGLDDPARYRASSGDWHFTTRVGKGVLVGASVIGFGANATPVAGSWANVRAAD